MGEQPQLLAWNTSVFSFIMDNKGVHNNCQVHYLMLRRVCQPQGLSNFLISHTYCSQLIGNNTIKCLVPANDVLVATDGVLVNWAITSLTGMDLIA